MCTHTRIKNLPVNIKVIKLFSIHFWLYSFKYWIDWIEGNIIFPTIILSKNDRCERNTWQASNYRVKNSTSFLSFMTKKM